MSSQQQNKKTPETLSPTDSCFSVYLVHSLSNERAKPEATFFNEGLHDGWPIRFTKKYVPISEVSRDP